MEYPTGNSKQFPERIWALIQTAWFRDPVCNLQTVALGNIAYFSFPTLPCVRASPLPWPSLQDTHRTLLRCYIQVSLSLITLQAGTTCVLLSLCFQRLES